MSKYLLKVSYTSEGIKGVMKVGGSARVAAVEKAIGDVGGSLESFYFAFGSHDVYVIVEFPDNATAMAVAASIGSSAAISSYETVVLLSPSEVDTAMQTTVAYQPPGA